MRNFRWEIITEKDGEKYVNEMWANGETNEEIIKIFREKNDIDPSLLITAREYAVDGHDGDI